MKSKQVLSVEQMKHLQELGLDTSDGSMCFEWNESDSDNMVVTSPDADTNYDYYHETYTLQDIIELLPRSIQPNPDGETFYLNLYYYDLSWVVDYLNNEGDGSYVVTTSNDSFIEAAYEMLSWCIENGYIEKKGD